MKKKSIGLGYRLRLGAYGFFARRKGRFNNFMKFLLIVDPARYESPESFDPESSVGGRVISWSLYDVSGTISDASRRASWVNYVLKYKLLVPAGLLVERFLGKRLTKKLPDGPADDLLNAYSGGFEDAISYWTTHYLQHPESSIKKGVSQRMLRLQKDISITIAMHDQAYREFFSLVSLFVTKRVLECNKGKMVYQHLMVPNVEGTKPAFVLDFYKMYSAVRSVGDVKEDGFYVQKFGDGYNRMVPEIKLENKIGGLE